MDLSIALRIIKENLRKEVIESRHFKKECEEKSLDINLVREVIRKNKLLGVLEQDENLYKVWFYYEKHKDLNIIMRILPNETLRFVTVFPCLAERRLR